MRGFTKVQQVKGRTKEGYEFWNFVIWPRFNSQYPFYNILLKFGTQLKKQAF